MVTLPLLLARHKVIFLWPWKTGGAPGAKTYKMGGRGPQGVFNPSTGSILSFQNFTEVPLSFLCWLQKLLLQLNWSIILYIHLLSTFQGGGLYCDPNSLMDLRNAVDFRFVQLFFLLWRLKWWLTSSLHVQVGFRNLSNVVLITTFSPSFLRRKRMW